MATPIFVDLSGRVPLENTSNDPVPNMQKCEIKASILEVQEEKHLDAEIARVQLLLKDLQLKVSSKKNKIATLQTMISPVKYLPNELISRNMGLDGLNRISLI